MYIVKLRGANMGFRKLCSVYYNNLLNRKTSCEGICFSDDAQSFKLSTSHCSNLKIVRKGEGRLFSTSQSNCANLAIRMLIRKISERLVHLRITSSQASVYRTVAITGRVAYKRKFTKENQREIQYALQKRWHTRR